MWARDRQALWNAAEFAEKRRDSRVAREYEVAVPHEFTKAQRVELVREFSQDLANRYNVAVDFAIHKPHRAGGHPQHPLAHSDDHAGDHCDRHGRQDQY